MTKGKKVPEPMPEFTSIGAFVQFLAEEGRTSFTCDDIQELSFGMRRGNLHAIRVELEAHGLTLVRRAHEKRVRGFTTSSNDRWFGPGSSPTHGGSGFDNRE